MTRNVRIAASALAASCGLVVGAAHGAVSGTVASLAGVPLSDVPVDLRDATGVAGHGLTDADGRFQIVPVAGRRGPFRVVASEFDGCRSARDPKRDARTEIRAVADGQTTVAIALDIRDMCHGRAAATVAPRSGATVDAATRTIIGRTGASLDLRIRIPYRAVDPRILLADGTRLSGRRTEDFDDLRLRLPSTPYAGPLTLSYEEPPTGVTRTLSAGTLVARPGPRRATPTAALDVMAVLDISRSTARSDRGGVGRRGAVELLARVSGPPDRLGVVGFDDRPRPIFALQQTAGPRSWRRLDSRLRGRVESRGGSDYNVAFEVAWDAVLAARPRTPVGKLLVLVVDGGHVGRPYASGHLRPAFADVLTGGPGSWPVCVVQIGALAGADGSRLGRIARDTGGTRTVVASGEDVPIAVLRCRAEARGATTLASRRVEVAPGSTSITRFSVPAGSARAEVVVDGPEIPRDGVEVLDPRGRPVAGTSRAGTVIVRVARPEAGEWQVRLTTNRTAWANVLASAA